MDNGIRYIKMEIIAALVSRTDCLLTYSILMHETKEEGSEFRKFAMEDGELEIPPFNDTDFRIALSEVEKEGYVTREEDLYRVTDKAYEEAERRISRVLGAYYEEQLKKGSTPGIAVNDKPQ